MPVQSGVELHFVQKNHKLLYTIELCIIYEGAFILDNDY